MGLLTEIKATGRRGPACAMQGVESALSKADLADLRAAFADTSITGSAIWRALKARGHAVAEETVRRHRAGQCNCASGS